MTSASGGLAGKLFETMQALADLKVIPAPVPMSTIAQAIDPSALKAFVASARK